MKRHILWAVFLTLMASASAKPPANMSGDPELKLWFESLHQPGTRQPCCSISDCRFVPFIIHDGRYEVTIQGFVYVVPRKTVIFGIPNPTGKAVTCYTFSEFRLPPDPKDPVRRPQDVAEILCFIPPRPPS